jgi:hypothetical protein
MQLDSEITGGVPGNQDPLTAAERGPFGEDVHRFVQLFL